ncbi:phosphopentomutase [Xylanivirga thermophila]|jgi:phosphopentomutase|uniref:phosphopentomutase n=1 Tax=Xylanivirga thermophila TaxID=2496273 RepID=UPI00101DF1D9|nr:phosphopentomutase [Xylanivirga thermophila]
MKDRRVVLIVLDSLGIGYMPDAHLYGDEGSNTICALTTAPNFKIETLKRFGMGCIDGIDCLPKTDAPIASFARMTEQSKGKDTTTGHWEISGIVTPTPFPTYPEGFPKTIIDQFQKAIGRKVLFNKPASGTEVIEKLGEEHMLTGQPIVYTSADSVFQIAAHEEIISIDELYEYCKIAREILKGRHAVARVIARPFIGEKGSFKRTDRRRDFSLAPPASTVLDAIRSSGYDVIGIGKINDIFAGKGITYSIHTHDNIDGMSKIELATKEYKKGLIFANLVDFDMLYGHRNDVVGYANALMEFDKWLGDFIGKLEEHDMLIITADHGCDPSTPSTDHSREYTPMLVYGKGIKAGANLGTRDTFADIAATVAEYLNVDYNTPGQSFLEQILI